MFNNTKQIVLAIVTGLSLASCSGSEKLMMPETQNVVISNEYVDVIIEAVNAEENDQRIEMFSDLQDYLSSQDPVFNNANGAAMLIKGEHEMGIALLRESITILMNDDVMYINKQNLPGVFAYSEQRIDKKSVAPEDNSEILEGLREFVQTGRERQLFRALEGWNGSLPVPPIYYNSGLPSLALETINEVYGKKIMTAYNISYFNPELNIESQRIRAVKKSSMNLMTAGILKGDIDVITEATNILRDIPVQFQSPESRFMIGLGLYLTGDSEWNHYVNPYFTAMFNEF